MMQPLPMTGNLKSFAAMLLLMKLRDMEDDMDDQYDDFNDDFEGMDDGCEDDWGDEPDVEDEPADPDCGVWDGPGERDWAVIFPIAEQIAREKREQERIRKSFDRKDDEI